MKKLLRILSIAIGVILLILILIPVLFKSRIEVVVKEKLNESVYATVDWSRFSLSLFRGFPNLSINLHHASVVGVGDFEGDTLVGLKRFEMRANPFSAFRSNIQVKSILLDDPLINAFVLEDGSANWDISRTESGEDEQEETESEGGGSSMSITLENFAIKNGRIYYKDSETKAEARLQDVNMDLSGDFSMEETDLELKVDMSVVDARYEGTRYMNQGTFRLDLLAAANLLQNSYRILDSEIAINDLVLGTEGEVLLMEDGGLDLDLAFRSKETSFHTLLSLVPAIYLSDFESLETSGSLALEGTAKGILLDSLMPDVMLQMQVLDGYFSYPDLPGDVSDVQIELLVDYKGTEADLTTIQLEKFHFSMAGNPFDAMLSIDHPISDMHVAGSLKGLIDFESLGDVLALEDLDLEGRIRSDLSFDTRMSYIENEQYEEVDLAGSLLVEGMKVETPDIPVPVELIKLELNFNPRFVILDGADFQMGNSDLHLEGSMSNFIPYVFKEETLSGTFKLSSNLVDADELTTDPAESEATAAPDGQEATTGPVDSLYAPSQMKIPENLDISMEVDMKKLIQDDILMENLIGQVRIQEGVAYMDGLELDVIGGHAKAKGSVDTRQEFALADLSLDLQEVDIPGAYSTFVTVERLAPMARFCRGDANVVLNFSSLLDASLSPLYETIEASGRIYTKDLQILNMKSFVRLSELLKSDKFREMAPKDMNIKFRVREGKVIVDPFDVSFDNSKITVSGLHGIDMSLDYLLDMNIAKTDLGKGAMDLMDGISSLASSAGFKIPESDYVKIKARIRGTFEKPLITTDLGDNLNAGKAEVKKMVEERVIEEIEKVEEEVREEASERADEILKEADEEAARIMEEARKAGDQLVAEAERQGENLVKEAGSNPLKKLAASKAAEELVRQAQKQSDNLIKEAETEAEEILKKARAEAERI